MSMAAEAAQRADAHMNLPEKKSGSRKSPHSLGRRAGAQRQHSSGQKSGRSSDEESPSEDEDEESSSEHDLQREEEHDSGGHEPYRDTQARAQAPVLTPRGVQQEFASVVQPGSGSGSHEDVRKVPLRPHVSLSRLSCFVQTCPLAT